MSKSVKASIKMLEKNIRCLNEVLKEIEKSLIRENQEGKMNVIIEKIETYHNELETMKLKVENIKDESEMKMIEEEVECIDKNIKTDTMINTIKREMLNQFKGTKEKWEITIDVMMIIGKYFERSIDYVNVVKLTKNINN